MLDGHPSGSGARVVLIALGMAAVVLVLLVVLL